MKNLSTKTVLFASLIIGILFLAGIVLAAGNQKDSGPAPTLPVLLEEFSDFQCPACGAYFGLIEEVLDEYGSDIEFVYKHFPLRTIHPNAFAAAIASEAAREQGKFMEYAEELFANQRNLGDETYLAIAAKLELDIDKFESDRKSPDIIARVNADIADGNSRGVNATPTFYIEGKKVNFGTSDPALKLRELLDEQIRKAKEAVSYTDSLTPTEVDQLGEEESVEDNQ